VSATTVEATVHRQTAPSNGVESDERYARTPVVSDPSGPAIAYLSPDLGVKVVLLCVLVVEVVCWLEGVARRAWMVRRKLAG
jgi:hypothetical protein